MFAPNLRLLSDILGWSYFTLWSISFYPQAFLNYRRKRVDGYSIDFATLNTIAFGCYSIYTINFLWNDRVREEYRQRHHGKDNAVAPNDFAFAIHAFTLCCITLGQTWIYPRAEGQQISRWHRFVVSALFTVATIEALAVVSSILPTIDFLYHLSYFKLYGSAAKCVSQAYLNYTRKSTMGWSIENVLLDFSGAILSLLQSLLIAHLDDNWSSITGNPVKLGLSILSIVFPSFFMLQHFVLYNDQTNEEAGRRAEANERTPLLEP